MQKKADNKQIWMTADRSNGSVIGNAQIGTVSGTKVIGNAVIGGMAACCESDVELAAAGLSRQTGSGSTVIGTAVVTGGVVGNAAIGGMAVGTNKVTLPLVPKRTE